MKIGIQLNENLQVVNYCSEEHYNAELQEIRVRSYPLGLVEIGEENPEDLMLKYYIDGIFYEKSVEEKRVERLASLEDDYNASKKITIQNGNTLIIEHNTPERSIFLDKLMIVSQENLLINVSISYQQKVNNSMYRFSALPTIWNYIFKDLFLTDRKTSDGTPTGFKENSREHNKIVFDAMVLKIQNSTTTEELNAISWEFANPNGVVIDVNDKATQMLNDVNVDDFTKQAINTLKDSTTGQIHLINIVK